MLRSQSVAMPISKSVYTAVRQRAQFRCEYCHHPELLSSAPISLDHIQPQSLGGDDIENLALACRRCNEIRYNFTSGIDPTTGIESEVCLILVSKNGLHISCGHPMD